jgi:predicted transposase/invertase (TIGR01784 family)
MPLLANFELKAIAKGEVEGKTEIVLRMHSKGLSVDEIADLTGLSVAQIAAIVSNLH